ncbi:MAG: peptide-binding protein [Pseudomonadota bacterium]
MYMIDRQWQMMSRMQSTMSEQAQDLRSLRGDVKNLRQQLNSGTWNSIPDASNKNQPATTESGYPTFSRARAVAQEPDYSTGGWQVSAFGVNLKTLTPLVSSDLYASLVQQYVLESLISRDPHTLEWRGHIAEEWKVSEDGVRIHFTLRSDINFSDGKPLTAHDVAFTYRFIMDERIAAPRQRAFFEKISRVEAINDREVEFTFAEPYFNALSLAGGMSILAEHFYGRYLDDPQTFNESKGLLFGSGPYRLADPENWTPDSGLVELGRNARYWGPLQPPFDRAIWRVIENDSARLTTFRNGEIDGYSSRPREYQELLEDSSIRAAAHNFEYMSPTAGYSYIGWNQLKAGKPTRFADKRVRQAMTYLTDRERIVEEIMLGYAEVAVSPFNPRSPQHNAGISARSFNVDRAAELLAAAGYRDKNGDGVLEDSNGDPFEFELVYFQSSEDTRRIVLFLKDLYARAGILLKPRATEWSVMIDLLDRRDFDAITLGWSGGIESDLYQAFHSSQINDNGDNFVGFSNSEFDQLVDDARATVDERTRMPLWRKAEAILFDEQPYTFLMRRKSLLFIDKRFKNLEVTRLGLNRGMTLSLYGGFPPIDTYVPSSEQVYPR